MRLRFLHNLSQILTKDVNISAQQIKQTIRRAHGEQKQLANDLFAAQYCLKLVEKNDYENYLCSLLLAGDQRRHVFALRAFNVEVANSGTNITEATIGKMRLQFWHDSVDKCFDLQKSYVADHPVLRELRNTATCHTLNRVHLKRLVTARDRPANEQFLTLQQLEEYAEQAFSSLLHLTVQLTGVRDMQVDHAISHLGKAQGIATLLRAIPHMAKASARQQRASAISVPQEILIKHGVSQERVLRDKVADKGVEESVFEVATAAHHHLEKARSLCDKVPKELRKLLLPAIAVERYLERLRRANFRLSDPSCMERDTMLPVSLYWANWRGKY